MSRGRPVSTRNGAIVVVATLLLIAPLLATGANAYHKNDIQNTCTSTVTWKFGNFPANPNLRDMVTEGIEWWNTVLDVDGTQLVTVTYDQDDPDAVPVNYVPLSKLGEAQCGLWPVGTYINISDQLVWKELRHVAAHEMGHILKLNHTGKHDASDGWENKKETMATCVNAATREFSKVTLDDAGSLTKQHSSENTTSDVPDILNANSGFEDGEISGVPADGWVEESGNPLAFRTGVSFEGDNALYFAPNDSLDRVTQIMNLTGMSGRDYEFTVRYQALQASGLSGRLYFVVHHREVEYGPDTDPDNCAWPSGRDENDVNWPKGVWEKTIDVRVLPVTASSWLGLNSGDPTVHNHANPSATGAWAWFPPSDAVDIRLRLRSSLKSGGAFVPVRIDNLTIRDCGTAIAGPDTKCSEYSPM